MGGASGENLRVGAAEHDEGSQWGRSVILCAPVSARVVHVSSACELVPIGEMGQTSERKQEKSTAR